MPIALRAKLHHPVFLQGCLRECEALRTMDDTRYRGTARVRIGPFGVLFRSGIDAEDIAPRRGWRMIGRGGPAGVANVRLRDVSRGTAVASTLKASRGCPA